MPSTYAASGALHPGRFSFGVGDLAVADLTSLAVVIRPSASAIHASAKVRRYISFKWSDTVVGAESGVSPAATAQRAWNLPFFQLPHGGAIPTEIT